MRQLLSKNRQACIALALFSGIFYCSSSHADVCTASTTISSVNNPGSCALSSGSLTVQSGGSIVSTTSAITTTGTLSNITINNGGLIRSTSGNSGDSAIFITNAVTGGIVNAGTLSTSGARGLRIDANVSIAGGITNTATGLITTGGGGGPGVRIDQASLTGGFINNGTIIGGWSGVEFVLGAIISGGVTNTGSITGDSVWGIALGNDGGIATVNGGINNTGAITGAATGLGIETGSTINNGIINSGTIVGTTNYGIDNKGTLDLISNIGNITGGSFGIRNADAGSIGTLNNMQSNSTLTYSGTLPTNYNIIIGSGASTTTGFGKVGYTDPSGTTTFGISSLSGNNIGPTGTRYQNVISGLAASYITNEAVTGTYTNGGVTASYQLTADDELIAGTWDLFILSMLNSTDIQSSLHASAQKLRGVFNSASISSNFANMNTYDCGLFDSKGICISAGGRYTTVDSSPSSNSTSAVVVVGYKASPNIRIGGFLDQNVDNNTPAGIKIYNKDPLMGAFAVWNQNASGLGYQVKVANAYQDKDIKLTRDVIGNSGTGSGSSNLNTQSYVGELSYAFMYQDATLLRPYLALRHTTIKQDAYTETGTSTPLTYAPLKDTSTTALLGFKLNHALTPKTNLTASLGIEHDLEHQVSQYSATSAGISGLSAENFNDRISRTRPVASAGAYYAVSKTQRISGDIFYQQLPFQRTGSATLYLNYMIGF